MRPKKSKKQKTKVKMPVKLSRLEKITKDYNSNLKAISLSKSDAFSPFDRHRPAYLLKEALNSHRLDDILKLYILITKDNRTCPFLLSKTGLLLFRKFIQLRNGEDELCNNLVKFVKYIRNFASLPTAEFFLDFLVFCCETGNEKLIKEFGDLRKDHVIRRFHLYISHMRLCFDMFFSFMSFKKFFSEFKEDGLDFKQYKEDWHKSREYTFVCVQLENVTIGLQSNKDYPLDYLFLCLIDLLVLFEDYEKAKELLIKYHKHYSTNQNAIIYMLKFNELYLNDLTIFKDYYNKLIILDPSNQYLLYYLDHLTLSVESLKILLHYVDFTMNKEDGHAWRLIYERLRKLKKKSPEEKEIKLYYNSVFASYWPTFHFKTVSVKINEENCDLIFHKAFIFYYFQPIISAKFVTQIRFILMLAKNTNADILNKLLNKIEL